ncbi:TIR domain-containing protein [Fibrella aquatilis]|uniref:Nucleotide-binding protein n=1 Tax=Fibrella aquatilis TaxID=2817059 RepID=A0A939JYX0_9BACT|nr:nucleotide-binding protein [Fibrella aquatilis]MBO0932544.1 nucleotide-binding protein [Fibrella aquatilis]
MHLDKTKLKQLIKKAEEVPEKGSINYIGATQTTIADQLSKIATGLSGWLSRHTNLTNGAAYGKKLAEIHSQLPAVDKRGFHTGYLSEKDAASARTKLLTLLRTIDKENKSVFIVHGRDHQMRDNVQSVLRGLGIATVVLEREDDNGQTIIEKFEKEAARCEYAVILCSADDEGRLRTKGRAKEIPLKPRARQNVVLELGYFLAKIGRGNLFVLYPEESIEQASDFFGVICQTYDKAEKWKTKLVRELKKAGFKIPAKLSDRI